MSCMTYFKRCMFLILLGLGLSACKSGGSNGGSDVAEMIATLFFGGDEIPFSASSINLLQNQQETLIIRVTQLGQAKSGLTVSASLPEASTCVLLDGSENSVSKTTNTQGEISLNVLGSNEVCTANLTISADGKTLRTVAFDVDTEDEGNADLSAGVSFGPLNNGEFELFINTKDKLPRLADNETMIAELVDIADNVSYLETSKPVDGNGIVIFKGKLNAFAGSEVFQQKIRIIRQNSLARLSSFTIASDTDDGEIDSITIQGIGPSIYGENLNGDSALIWSHEDNTFNIRVRNALTDELAPEGTALQAKLSNIQGVVTFNDGSTTPKNITVGDAGIAQATVRGDKKSRATLQILRSDGSVVSSMTIRVNNGFDEEHPEHDTGKLVLVSGPRAEESCREDTLCTFTIFGGTGSDSSTEGGPFSKTSRDEPFSYRVSTYTGSKRFNDNGTGSFNVEFAQPGKKNVSIDSTPETIEGKIHVNGKAEDFIVGAGDEEVVEAGTTTDIPVSTYAVNEQTGERVMTRDTTFNVSATQGASVSMVDSNGAGNPVVRFSKATPGTSVVTLSADDGAHFSFSVSALAQQEHVNVSLMQTSSQGNKTNLRIKASKPGLYTVKLSVGNRGNTAFKGSVIDGKSAITQACPVGTRIDLKDIVSLEQSEIISDTPSDEFTTAVTIHNSYLGYVVPMIRAELWQDGQLVGSSEISVHTLKLATQSPFNSSSAACPTVL